MRRLLVWCAVFLSGCAVSGCADRPVTVATPRATGSVAAPAPPSPDDPAEMVARADNLFGVYLSRSGLSLSSRSLWGASCDHDECTPAVLVTRSPERGAGHYRLGTYDDLQRRIWAPKPPGAPELGGCATSVGEATTCVKVDGHLTTTHDGGDTWEPVGDPFDGRLLLQPLVSFAPGVDAVLGGGDGATLFPFDQVARPWSQDDVSTYPVEQPDGVTAYSSGAVVLSDGRVLALLADWSDDRPGRPSDRHHGLWASDGANWSTYAPATPTFSPPLTPPDGSSPLVALEASVDPDPVIWVITWDLRVYVSTDDAVSFTELPVR